VLTLTTQPDILRSLGVQQLAAAFLRRKPAGSNASSKRQTQKASASRRIPKEEIRNATPEVPFEQVDGRRVALAAPGEMAVVAIYAALLDGQVETLLLEDPPATQNVASQPDGEDNALEMLGCLRVTDLPQVGGLLYPAELVFIGECPSTYDWAEELYRKLGAANRFRRVSNVGDWRPSL